MKQVFVVDDERSRFHAKRAVEDLPLDRAKIVTIQNETRKLSQNAQQWPILNAFANQLLWPINGALTKITAEDWKNILTSAYRQETVRVAQGFESGLVMLGHRTREFRESEWSEWMSWLEWAATEKGVKIPISKSLMKAIGLDL